MKIHTPEKSLGQIAYEANPSVIISNWDFVAPRFQQAYQTMAAAVEAAVLQGAALTAAQPAALPAKCNPTLTECPRCKNDIAKCDGIFKAQPCAATSPANWATKSKYLRS